MGYSIKSQKMPPLSQIVTKNLKLNLNFYKIGTSNCGKICFKNRPWWFSTLLKQFIPPKRDLNIFPIKNVKNTVSCKL